MEGIFPNGWVALETWDEDLGSRERGEALTAACQFWHSVGMSHQDLNQPKYILDTVTLLDSAILMSSISSVNTEATRNKPGPGNEWKKWNTTINETKWTKKYCWNYTIIISSLNTVHVPFLDEKSLIQIHLYRLSETNLKIMERLKDIKPKHELLNSN